MGGGGINMVCTDVLGSCPLSLCHDLQWCFSLPTTGTGQETHGVLEEPSVKNWKHSSVTFNNLPWLKAQGVKTSGHGQLANWLKTKLEDWKHPVCCWLPTLYFFRGIIGLYWVSRDINDNKLGQRWSVKRRLIHVGEPPTCQSARRTHEKLIKSERYIILGFAKCWGLLRRIIEMYIGLQPGNYLTYQFCSMHESDNR